MSFAIVPGIANTDVFGEAVKGVTGVIHTAAPFETNAEDKE
jgi:hypothetical protein